MENQFFKSEGINKGQLKLIIGLISVRLLIGLYTSFGISDDLYGYHILNIFFKVCDLVCVVYLYKFVGIDLGQKIFLFLIVLIELVNVYLLFASIYMLFLSVVNGVPVYSIYTNQFYANIPFILLFPLEIIIGMQLISNTAGGDLQPAIKFVGVSYIVELVGMCAMLALQSLFMELFVFYSFFYFVLFSLSNVAMLYMYVTALKDNSHKEVI